MTRHLSAPAAIFLAISTVVGLAMVFLTPPFQVPDEVGHFWHAYALARGEIFPPLDAGRAVVHLPQGPRDLVATLWVDPGTRTKFNERLRAAARLPYVTSERSVKYPVFYSPVPYLPQALGCFVGDRLCLTPLVTFYLGRLACLFTVIAIMLMAIQASDELSYIVCAVGLLPMTLFLFASYSADALTIALTCLATALARRPGKSLYAVALLLGLCKPPYLLVVLLAFASRRWRAAVFAAIAAFLGMVVGAAFTAAGFNVTRPEAKPAVQIETLRHEPLSVAVVLCRDIAANAKEHLDELVGRLGWLDIPIPRAAHYAMLALLLWIAATAGVSAKMSERLTAAAICAVCFVAIELSQYIIWTAPGAKVIEGVQGRYFIPLLPILFIAVSRRWREARFTPAAVAVMTIFANGGALLVLWRRYFA